MLSERKVVNDKKASVWCLRSGHIASKCKNPKFIIGKQSHFVIICNNVGLIKGQNLIERKPGNELMPYFEKVSVQTKRDEALRNLNSCDIFSKNFWVVVIVSNGGHCVRTFMILHPTDITFYPVQLKLGWIKSQQQYSAFGNLNVGNS